MEWKGLVWIRRLGTRYWHRKGDRALRAER
jgi:hypothetical protein